MVESTSKQNLSWEKERKIRTEKATHLGNFFQMLSCFLEKHIFKCNLKMSC